MENLFGKFYERYIASVPTNWKPRKICEFFNVNNVMDGVTVQEKQDTY
jgi:hypothetical protein